MNTAANANIACQFRQMISEDGKTFTLSVLPKGMGRGEWSLIGLGLIGGGLCGALYYIIHQTVVLPNGLRLAWGCCAVAVGLVLVLFGVCMALKAARSHATVTIDDQTMIVEQIGLALASKRYWMRSALRSITPFGGERGLQVESTTGERESILCDLKQNNFRMEIAAALRARLGMSPFFSSKEVFLKFASTMDLMMASAHSCAGGDPPTSIHLFIESALAERGGRTEFPLPGDLGGSVIDVKIPAGIPDGQRIRLRGAGKGGQDLIIELHVRPNLEV